jgi:hypothetical protein
MKADWVREIRDQCLDHDVAFFFKRWGGLRPKSGSRELDGKEWRQFPKVKHAVGTPAFNHFKKLTVEPRANRIRNVRKQTCKIVS